MVRTAWMFTASLASALVLLGAGSVKAEPVVFYPPPQVSYYPPPVVSYYAPPAVYVPAPRVAYYYTPSVSYYAPPAPYYTAPATVTTTRYGLFGNPRVSTTRYYPPVYVAP